MLLNSIMEDAKLNFDQPLLSVRRHAPPATSRRTERRKINKSQPLIPRLPFHRSELKSGPITNPGSVPFTWEQSPGQPKEETKPQTLNCDKPPIAPKLPPGRYATDCRKVSPNTVGCNNQSVSSPRSSDNETQDVDVHHDENVQTLERSNKAAEEKENSDSGDSDGVYVDALDTLSRAESSFLNCSMSGISGLGELNVKPSGNFSTDAQAREFMMDRFLPAAKAMASETPQYAPKKHPVVQPQPQQVKKTVDQHKPSLRYGPSFAARYSHYQESEEEEESDDEYDHRQNMSGVCGLLPRFCLKNSLGRLNPVPGMSVRTRVPISSAKKVQPRSSSGGSFSETESGSGRMEIKSMDKIQTDELDKDNTTLRNESGHLESHSSSTYRGSSPPFLEEKEAISVPEENGKGFKTFQELLVDQESDLGDPVEKTLYVDTEEKVESPNLKSFSPKTRDVKVVPSLREDDHEILTKMIDLDSSLQDFNKLNAIEGDNKSIQKPGTEMPQGFGENRDFSLFSTTRETTQVVTEQELMESSENHLSQAVTLENSHQNYSGLPGPPPLPKSPSDSWLCRTLPSMPGKSSSLRLYLGAATNLEKQCKKAPTSDMKWETIVKTTKVQRRHLHYSEELLTTIPET